MGDATAAAQAAATSAVAVAQLAASLGTAQARLAYPLTNQMLDGTKVLAFPLLLLSGVAIVEGLTAYTVSMAAGRVAQKAAAAELAAAKGRIVAGGAA